jgi:hypothetical protein
MAVLASRTLAFLIAELGIGIAVVVQCAMGPYRGGAVFGAVVVNRHGIRLAELARSAFLVLLAAKFVLSVAMGVRVACTAEFWLAVQRAFVA